MKCPLIIKQAMSDKTKKKIQIAAAVLGMAATVGGYKFIKHLRYRPRPLKEAYWFRQWSSNKPELTNIPRKTEEGFHKIFKRMSKSITGRPIYSDNPALIGKKYHGDYDYRLLVGKKGRDIGIIAHRRPKYLDEMGRSTSTSIVFDRKGDMKDVVKILKHHDSLNKMDFNIKNRLGRKMFPNYMDAEKAKRGDGKLVKLVDKLIRRVT